MILIKQLTPCEQQLGYTGRVDHLIVYTMKTLIYSTYKGQRILMVYPAESAINRNPFPC